MRFRGAVKTFSPHEALGSNGSLKAGALAWSASETLTAESSIATAPPAARGGKRLNACVSEKISANKIKKSLRMLQKVSFKKERDKVDC